MQFLRAHLGMIQHRKTKWIGFYGIIIASWIALFAMQAALSVPEDYNLLGREFWEQICRTSSGDLHFFGVFFMWALMSLGMMLPTAIPTFQTYDDLSHTDAANGASFAALVGGYVTVWFGFSLAASGLQLLLDQAGALTLDGKSVWPLMNAVLFGLAGLYQFSSLKEACLNKCRMPITFFMERWKPGSRHAYGMGLHLGLLCLGCCWALMLLAFVGGVMSVLWMLGAMILMSLEKLPNIGERLTRPLGFILMWVATGTALSLSASLILEG